jgi:hypothetical protein
MHVGRKSDGYVVFEKSPNSDGLAEEAAIDELRTIRKWLCVMD